MSPPVPDGDGSFTQTAITATPPTWHVAIEPATARDVERLAAGTVLATATHIITGPYHPAVTWNARLRLATGRIFSVVGLASPEERTFETVALCVEVLPV